MVDLINYDVFDLMQTESERKRLARAEQARQRTVVALGGEAVVQSMSKEYFASDDALAVVPTEE